MILEIIIMTGLQAAQAEMCSSPGHKLAPVWDGSRYIVGVEVLADPYFSSCKSWLSQLPQEQVTVTP